MECKRHLRCVAPTQSAPGSAETKSAHVNGKLELVIVGGGVIGLLLALSVLTTIEGRKRIRVYDNRWTFSAGSGLHWQPQADECEQRLRHVVSLDESIWNQLPPELQERLFPSGSFVCQWPVGKRLASRENFPRNIALDEFENRLLEIVQDPSYGTSVEFYSAKYTQAEHDGLLKRDPFHAIVLADGAAASFAREEVFGSILGVGSDKPSCTTNEFLALAFNTGELRPRMNMTESTVLSVAQQCCALTALDDERGSITISMSNEEKQEAVGVTNTHGQISVESFGMTSLQQRLLDALMFFGIHQDAVTSITQFHSRFSQRQQYHAKFPMPSSSAIPHASVFLIGEAAEMMDLWPGQELRAAVQGVSSVVRQLERMQTRGQAGRSTHHLQTLAKHSEVMRALHCQLSEIHRKQAVNLPADNKHQGAEFVGDAFLEAVRLTHKRLADGRLAPDQASNLPTMKSLLQKMKIVHSGLTAAARQRLGDSGPRSLQVISLLASLTTLPEDADAGSVAPMAAVSVVAEPLAKDQAITLRSAKSLFNRGVRHLHGKGVDRDANQAADCFRLAAKTGHKEAQYALGVMLLEGRGNIKQDLKEANSWFEKAAAQGHAKAQYNLGIMYQYGAGVARDMVEASAWTTRAASSGHVRAVNSAALNTFGGGGRWMAYDHTKVGVDGILKEAQAGNKHAQHKMGVMYYLGDGVDVDKGQASFWFMQGARSGLCESQYQISRMLFLGDGVQRDEDYAFKFLVKAAEQGHVESQHNLGVKLYFGEGVDMDRLEAAFWFRKAATQGLPESQNNLGWMLYLGDAVEQDAIEGRRWLLQAARKGNEEAKQHLTAIEGW